MDVIKKKISNVLQLFKESLEEKSSKKIQELESKLVD
jgi:2-polyprenyl-3-methyl-5-hydroxy-6-metoxy-1,4-benzoquinol methylase